MSVLNAACRGITNLTGMNDALNLATLDLGDNSISNISPLSSSDEPRHASTQG